jgi:hypothetical protein
MLFTEVTAGNCWPEAAEAGVDACGAGLYGELWAAAGECAAANPAQAVNAAREPRHCNRNQVMERSLYLRRGGGPMPGGRWTAAHRARSMPQFGSSLV